MSRARIDRMLRDLCRKVEMGPTCSSCRRFKRGTNPIVREEGLCRDHELGRQKITLASWTCERHLPKTRGAGK